MFTKFLKKKKGCAVIHLLLIAPEETTDRKEVERKLKEIAKDGWKVQTLNDYSVTQPSEFLLTSRKV